MLGSLRSGTHTPVLFECELIQSIELQPYPLKSKLSKQINKVNRKADGMHIHAYSSSPPSRFLRRYASFGAMTVGTNGLTSGFN